MIMAKNKSFQKKRHNIGILANPNKNKKDEFYGESNSFYQDLIKDGNNIGLNVFVFTDCDIDFSKKIKNDPLFKRIPILMVTSVAEVTGHRFSLEEDGYWMKTDDFLDKPVMPDVLISMVEKLLRKKERES